MSGPLPRSTNQGFAGGRQRHGPPQKPQPFAGLQSDLPPDAAPLQLTVFGLPADLHVRRSSAPCARSHGLHMTSRLG